MDKNKALIIGAGVSGLSSGIKLLENDYSVHIWAKDLPPNTTSDIAAAFWLPYLSKPKEKVKEWSVYTYKYLEQNALDDASSGCFKIQSTGVSHQKVPEPLWAEDIQSYRTLQREEIPGNFEYGSQVDAIVMDTTLYMDWLMNKYKSLGGTLERKEIKNKNELFENSKLVINCAGLGARDLFEDASLFPIRGQVLTIAKNNYKGGIVADSSHSDRFLMIVPRKNDIVLGGTAQENDWNLKVSPDDTEKILNRVQEVFPEFRNAKIIAEKVGLRPARPEVRVEIERFDDSLVVHNYGHGGSGFTLSWGCAEDVVKLARGV